VQAPDTVQSPLDQKAASEIAVEACVYLYPLVLMERTRRQMTNVERPGDVLGRGPVNAFAHFREYPPAGFKDVVKPNFDTLYSPAWFDLREEPRIVSLPATDLYFLAPIYDMWSDIFACPGTPTNGAVAGDYAICGPDWEGESLDLRIGATEPPKGSSNWLPAPGGPFNLCLRMYYPESSVLEGAWTPPGVLKAEPVSRLEAST